MEDLSQKSWFAVYVKSRNEKKVAREFEAAEIEHFLPLVKELRQWSDRRKWVEAPLFRSYIFVRVSSQDYDRVLRIPGVVRYISFEGKAVPIPPAQIQAIRYYLDGYRPDESPADTDWQEGQQVEVISGSLSGLQGRLVEVKGKHKLSVQIDAIGKSILIKIPKNRLRII